MSEAWKSGSDRRWRTFRAALLSQWARQGRKSCEIRGPRCTVAVQDVDHIVPLGYGGEKYDPLNCRPACGPCNKGRRLVIVAEPEPLSVSNW